MIKYDDELLNKLNYIIYMMEEQQNQKTNYVTEELILPQAIVMEQMQSQLLLV